MNYGRVEEPSSSRNRLPSTARFDATSAILTVILSRSDRAPISRTVNARPAGSADFRRGRALVLRVLAIRDKVSGPIINLREIHRIHSPLFAPRNTNEQSNLVKRIHGGHRTRESKSWRSCLIPESRDSGIESRHHYNRHQRATVVAGLEAWMPRQESARRNSAKMLIRYEFL